MKYNITNIDKDALLQSNLHYKYRLFLLKDGKIMDTVTGISGTGSYSIDSESDVRRTFSLTMHLGTQTYSAQHVEQKIESLIGYDLLLQIGIYHVRQADYIWYECGKYTITGTNTSYDAVSNTLSMDLSDWFTKLDGTKNGQVGGAPTIQIPNLDANGEKITIRQAVLDVLKDIGLENYILQDVGEFYGMDINNPDYETYREANPMWNQLPYDLEYNCGCYVSEILTDIRDLYPNCEMYFDIYNNFCFNMIPSCNNEPVVLDNDFLQQILLAENSENVSYDITTVKNVTEVFGKTYEVDRYSDSCTVSDNLYKISLSGYNTYSHGDILAFTVPASNTATMCLSVNSLASIPIYQEYTTDYIASETIPADSVCCVKIIYLNGTYAAYYLGEFQPHALCVLTNDAEDTFYTKEYFSDKYNCKTVTFREEPDNPFAIQKLGIVFETKCGDSFDNIMSDTIAMANAVFQNRQSSTINDTVTLTTKMIPFLDVNVKVSYQKQQESEIHEYIVKSVSHDLEGMTSTITLHRFHPLYFD
ncbi:MAG: DUF5048 domain-containing protein [Lachnospiraceae bacterium]|nr:DUF5048 domain-containing protein [Lachnospiraceae bacterium]MBD5537774.1 DUF5048 domain-containing protein [Lachnospiraceae bacterium]